MDSSKIRLSLLKAKGEWPDWVLPYLDTIDSVATSVFLLLQGEEILLSFIPVLSSAVLGNKQEDWSISLSILGES